MELRDLRIKPPSKRDQRVVQRRVLIEQVASHAHQHQDRLQARNQLLQTQIELRFGRSRGLWIRARAADMRKTNRVEHGVDRDEELRGLVDESLQLREKPVAVHGAQSHAEIPRALLTAAVDLPLARRFRIPRERVHETVGNRVLGVELLQLVGFGQ